MKSSFLIKAFNKVAIIISLFSVSSPAVAGSYNALCGGMKCNIYISPEVITSPYGSIPTDRVTNWGGGGDSSTSVGTGVTTTIFLGPIGLLGFLAKKHDYNFLINGYDEEGKKTSMQFSFKNDKPAKRLINELQLVTELGMGQKRTAKEIRKRESKGKETLELGRYKSF